ncbi:MAG: hypothetical protein PHF37_06495 [Phycisphaerae bacterium]|nr:hypothetical protein [Phycisphaerae bacterium]
MPKKGDKLNYDNRAGMSQFPINPYSLIKLSRVRSRQSVKFGFLRKYITYYWILNPLPIRDMNATQPKFQRFFTVRVDVEIMPDNPPDNYRPFLRIRQKQLRKGTIYNAMKRDGFTLVDSALYFNRKNPEASWSKFYELVGYKKGMKLISD